MKNKVNISIDGKPFTLVGTESEEYIESVADYVNEKIAFIRESDKNSFLTRDLAVILTCVNLADELFKEREKLKGIDPEENAALKDTVSELEEEIDDLLNYNRKLTEEFEEERDALEREKEDFTLLESDSLSLIYSNVRFTAVIVSTTFAFMIES